MSERSKGSGRSGSHCVERIGYRHLDKMYRALSFLCTSARFHGVYETPKVVLLLFASRQKRNADRRNYLFHTF